MASRAVYGSEVSVTLTSLLAHFFGLAAAALMLVWVLHFGGGLDLKSDNKTLIFNVHPFVAYVGFIFLSGQAFMAYSNIIWTQGKVQKFVHMVLNLAALAFAIFGIYAVFKYHNEVNIPDMYSLHSWLGMVTISLFSLQWLFGFFSFWYPRFAAHRRAKLAPWHALTGFIIFIMAICTAETGLVEWATFSGLRPGKESLVVNFTGLTMLLYGAAVTLTVIIRR